MREKIFVVLAKTPEYLLQRRQLLTVRTFPPDQQLTQEIVDRELNRNQIDGHSANDSSVVKIQPIPRLFWLKFIRLK